MERLEANLLRTGLKVTVVIADALQWQPEGQFDAILLDAPCSATGTIRRHPDLPFVKDGSEVAGLVALQAALRLAKQAGYLSQLAICNAPESSLVRESELVMLTRAGPEIGVASTKAFTTQITALSLLVIALAVHTLLG